MNKEKSCTNCKFCNLRAYHCGKWYCGNPDVHIGVAVPLDLPCFSPRRNKYSEKLEQWEQEAYNGGYGSDWLGEVGEGVKFYVMSCEAKGKRPTFTGLMNYLESMSNLGGDKENG